MTRPKTPVPPAPRVPLTLEDRARHFVKERWPFDGASDLDLLVKFPALFADVVLLEAEHTVTDQNRHPQKLSRLYWQARMDAGREIHELRRGRGGAA